MDECSLFAAIGGVDETYLQELEHPQTRRLSRHFGLIAAVLALLLTACAAPVILRHFDALKDGGIQSTQQDVKWNDLFENPEQHISPYKSDTFTFSDTVILRVNRAEDAPQTITQHYLPESLLDYTTLESINSTDAVLSLELSAKVPKYGRVYGLLYQQRIIPEGGRVEVPGILEPGFWEETFTTYGDISAMEITGDTTYEDENGNIILEEGGRLPRIFTKHVFWSDGHYLFCLKIPITYGIPITALEEIVTSLTPVDDISEYLPKNS